MDNLQIYQSSLNGLQMWFPTILYGFIGSLPMYILAWYNMDQVSDRFRATYSDTADTFDFIVVGAGSSGAVVANRLSRNHKVLLLEAGGEPNPFSSVPGLSFLMLNYPQVDWMHKTVPQKHCCGALPNKQSGWSAGKGLGGTSNLNFLIHLRGHRKDFDYWANLTGDPSWSYEGLLPYFKSVENYQGEFDSDLLHGHKGDMPLSLPDYKGMSELFVQAAEELGYPRVDLNGNYSEGFSPVFNPVKNGRRQGTFRSFIEPVRGNPNLIIYKFSQVNKILMSGPQNEAYGVEYERHGVKKFAYAKKEVIVSAGSINSPKLLMLSGIGPREHLESLNIPVKSELPVGKNLQDHISIYFGPFFVNEPITMLLDRDLTATSFVEFTRKGTGPLTSSGCHAAGFFSSSKAKEVGEGDWPDIQFILLGTAVYEKMAKDFSHAFHIDENIMQRYLRHAKGKDSFQIITSLARPLSRGDIRLESANPNAPLLIDPNYLAEPSDVQVLIEGLRKAIELVENTTTFQKYGGKFTNEPFPGCEDVPFLSDAYLECYIRQYSITLHHIVGSCSMGKKHSKDAVVDPELKVIGTKRLRVIDASIMPKVPISNTNAACITIGEKGAHLVMKTWENSIENENNEIIR